MDLKDQLLTMHSKLNTINLAHVIGTNKNVFRQLIDLMMTHDTVLSPRAAYTADYCTEINPDLIDHEYERIINNLFHEKKQPILRHSLRMLSRYEIPEKYEGYLFDFCLSTLENQTNDIAVRVYAMQLLYNISERQSDLKPELKVIFENYSDHESAGMRSRSSRLMKQLDNELKNKG
ncbi:MAG: hypothetical protein GVY19_04565 [Bacteroidetes bacterium]|jgi:hypothetical protein|nr:hypothetical protein [Bacteroidota bacterium]